jgi:hypothetical protein
VRRSGSAAPRRTRHRQPAPAPAPEPEPDAEADADAEPAGRPAPPRRARRPAADRSRAPLLGGPRPGALALRDWLAQAVPEGRFGGAYVCRRVRGGRGVSLHGAGRAVDWMLNAGNARQREAGDRLVARCSPATSSSPGAWASRRSSERPHLDRVARLPGAAPLPPGRGGSMHRDHVHLGMNDAGAAKTTTFWNR